MSRSIPTRAEDARVTQAFGSLARVRLGLAAEVRHTSSSPGSWASSSETAVSEPIDIVTPIGILTVLGAWIRWQGQP